LLLLVVAVKTQVVAVLVDIEVLSLVKCLVVAQVLNHL
jgi:hypothetical protein